MNKISVILPIYNVEKYLPACLDSIVNQTYQNLEIILVNDGSTDACPNICDEYGKQDKRIKVIHKKNGGLSDARNAGIAIATGEFISFIDSDDLVSHNFFDILVRNLVEQDADIIECNFLKFQKESELDNIYSDVIVNSQLYSDEKILEHLLIGPLDVMVWNKIYRKKTINNIQFPVNKINEDEFWTYKVFGNAQKVVKIQDVLYYYRQQSTSIMGTSYSMKRLDALEAMEERIGYMKQYSPNIENHAIKAFCFCATYHYQQLYNNIAIDHNQDIRKKIYNKVKKYYKFSILKHWHWKDIIWYQLFIWFPTTYMKLRDYMEIKAQRLSNLPNNV